MYALGRDFLDFGEIEELSQGVLCALGVITDHPEVIATAANLDIEPGFQQPQILVEGSAEIGQARVIRGLEVEFPLQRVG
jgi:hypothetical protein